MGCPTLPAWPPAPEVLLSSCEGDQVCLSAESARALGLWFRDLSRFRQASDLCRSAGAR